MADPAVMPPIPVPDAFSLDETISFMECFVGGWLVQHRQSVVMELYHGLHPLSPTVPARVILATKSRRPGLWMRELLPKGWIKDSVLPCEDFKFSTRQTAQQAFDEMEARGDRLWYFLYQFHGISAALVSAPRQAPELAPLLQFNRRSSRPLVAGMSIVHGRSPGSGPARSSK